MSHPPALELVIDKNKQIKTGSAHRDNSGITNKIIPPWMQKWGEFRSPFLKNHGRATGQGSLEVIAQIFPYHVGQASFEPLLDCISKTSTFSTYNVHLRK